MTKKNTALSARDRKAVAKVFKAAKQYLADTGESNRFGGNPKFQYICWAIGEVTTPGGFEEMEHMSRVGKLATDIIENRLRGCLSLTQWVMRFGNPKTCDSARFDAMANQGRGMQKHRQAWLNLLIAEFEAPA